MLFFIFIFKSGASSERTLFSLLVLPAKYEME